MKSILSIFSLVMLSLLAVADDPKPKLDGSWEMTKAVVAGNDMPEEIVKAVKMVFKGNECETDVMDKTQHCTVTLDDTTNPKRIKIEAKDGPDGKPEHIHCSHDIDQWCPPAATA